MCNSICELIEAAISSRATSNECVLILGWVCKAINDASHQGSIYGMLAIKRNWYCGLLATYGTSTYCQVDSLLGNWTNSK